MLNPNMNGWNIREVYRQDFEQRQAEQRAKVQLAPPNPAPGSMEWFALQEKLKNSS